MPDAGESTTDRREKLAGYQRSIAGAGDKNTLIEAIQNALNVSAPVGSPSTLDDIAKRYAKQADAARDVQDRVEQIAQKGLPDAWVGSTGAKAQEVVSAAARAAAQMDEAIRGARRALILLSDALTTAQSADKGGREQLREALGMLGGEDGFFDDMVEKDAEEAERLRARNIASAGAKTMHAAAEKADDAAREAARDLNKFAAEARAGKMKTDNISAADRLVLADISGTGGPAEMNELLTANDLERSGKAMERMNARDQAEFERMLAESKSPQERAYLVKALRRRIRPERGLGVPRQDPRQGPGLAAAAPDAGHHGGRQHEERGPQLRRFEQEQGRPGIQRGALVPGRQHVCAVHRRQRPCHGRPCVRPRTHRRPVGPGGRPRRFP
ncbi:WXG100 family type VII secretion target [Streptomyces sp. ISL-100]|uniref:WXG100 family type VII secretion target n=1 Tax=Streptomyces sp. ISL-100 TaxID=2819173 RepID=UPI002034D67F|nr:WXG100 family type VII secretion target [Streptomyces sp. ISL-100]